MLGLKLYRFIERDLGTYHCIFLHLEMLEIANCLQEGFPAVNSNKAGPTLATSQCDVDVVTAHRDEYLKCRAGEMMKITCKY